jgi:DinB superfamily/Pentapeptide repeats (8 copies)
MNAGLAASGSGPWRLRMSPHPGNGSSGAGVILPSMTATNDPAGSVPASPGEPEQAQFGPHRFYAGEGGGSEQFRDARVEAADLRGARFTDCDLTGVTIRDGWLVNVSISGYLSNVTVNGVDVTDFVNAELDRRHPERVQFREGQTAGDVRALWDTIERLWVQATERAGRLPAAAVDQQVNEEWSFAQTLRHLVFITDAWASATVLDEKMPYHPLGLPQSWYPAADAAVLGIDLTARPGYGAVLAARADRMAVMRRIVAGLTGEGLGRLCQRPPAPGYPDEERTVIDCLAVVMDEEIEHYRFAVRDLAVLESR